jgi:hypothetical protein
MDWIRRHASASPRTAASAMDTRGMAPNRRFDWTGPRDSDAALPLSGSKRGAVPGRTEAAPTGSGQPRRTMVRLVPHGPGRTDGGTRHHCYCISPKRTGRSPVSVQKPAARETMLTENCYKEKAPGKRRGQVNREASRLGDAGASGPLPAARAGTLAAKPP